MHICFKTKSFGVLLAIYCRLLFSGISGLFAQGIIGTEAGNSWWLPDYVEQTPGYGIGWVDGDFVDKWESWYPSDADADEIHFSAHIYFQWQDLNPAQGVFDWTAFDDEFMTIVSTPHLGVQLYPSLESRMVGAQGWPGAYESARYAVPHWLETEGFNGKKVEFTSCGDPVYWTPESGYLDALEVFLDTLAKHVVDGYSLKDHPRLQSVEMRCNDYMYGEGQIRCGTDEWLKFGYTPERYVAAQKRMIDAYMNAFPGQSGRLVFMTMDDRAADDFYEPWEYAIGENGWGFRDGQLEVWMRYVLLGWGIYWDQDTEHLVADETWHPSMVNNSIMATELESLGNDSDFGARERAALHHYVATLRALQSRRNWLYFGTRPYIYNLESTRELTRYAQLSVGKTRQDSPDAWAWLRQCEANARYLEYGSDKAGFPGPVRHSGIITVKNFERWLEQYDLDPDGNTVPAPFWLEKIYAGAWDRASREADVVYDQWIQADQSGNTEYWARRTDYAAGQNSIYFNIDPEWYRDYAGDCRLFISYLDTNNSTWIVEYDDPADSHKSSEPVSTGNTNELKTVTFELNMKAGNGFPGGTDFRILRTDGGDAVIHLVRLVKCYPEPATFTAAREAGRNTGDGPGLSNHPNPFHKSTRIEFSLSSKSVVVLDILDLDGRKIGCLVSGHLNPGLHSVSWNAAGADGSRLPEGIYIARLKTSGRVRFLRMMLVRPY